MQETLPLLRSAARAVSQPSSRIPHLRFHIACRQSRVHQFSGDCKSQSKPSRSYSNVASNTLDRRLFQDVEADEETVTTQTARTVQSRVNPQSSRKAISKRKESGSINMFDILEDGLQDQILTGLMSHSIGTPFIEQADNHMFNKALLALDTDYFIEPFKAIERLWKGKKMDNVLQVKTLNHRISSFALYLDHIVATRRQSGKRLDIEACNHVLKCARSIGDASMARSIFETIMPEDAVKPTLESYDYYTQALTWSRVFDSSESLQLRVIPRNVQMRASRKPPLELSGHKTKSRLLAVKGLREEVLDIFRDCVTAGHAANEITFVSLMIAMGREADLDGVKSVLKSVWNINVDLLETYDEEEVESPTFYEIDHPLRPSQELLFTVAHVFGINNDVRTAWSLVDFISRNYDLPISENVWQQLCEWALVLSLHRTPAERKQNRDLGQIPQQFLVQMVGAMSDEPHNIKPNAAIHWLLCRSWRDKKHLDNTVHHVRELQQIVDQQQADMKVLVEEVLTYARAAPDLSNPFTSRDFYDLRRRYTTAFFELQRNMQFINVAVNRNLLSFSGWPGSGKLTEWERRKLPLLIEQFSRYLPTSLKYKTKTGTVELDTRITRYATSWQKHKLDIRILPRILNAIDTDDQARLERRMRALPAIVLKARNYCMKCESIGHKVTECHRNPFTSADWAIFRAEDQMSYEAGDAHDDDVFVLNPDLPRKSVPFALEPGSEKEFKNPSLPYS